MVIVPAGVFQIPGSYVEFAYRGLLDSEVETIVGLPQPIDTLNGLKRRDGFETQNADKIFESTFVNAANENDDTSIVSYEASREKILPR